ncbi:MAG: tRNA (adenosine(37)-N6)-threonylcarbamoyltransferase complex transferase subunit TsaD [Chitinophagales bacterium]|nr:tRNA (adenosine(37)-N6)-threonylcarbamoyltransferase complex transferase subunit TsaD [Chitinophagales bacterium]MDW8419406.1 tRNA (adenosine(37)-N6)-threonylcarbamoyltransferase complex transferase subunit TsaD [Chitinophagales bacterium]
MVNIVILAIESSCDDTSAAVIYDAKILANLTASQAVHQQWGGVVPELASRAHQINIVPVVDAALKKANVSMRDLRAVAFTRGPGLIGSLLVGVSFAKAFALALDIPLIEVNHMQAHVMAHFIDNRPGFPFLCLTVSGGHTQLVLVRDYLDMEVVGETLDDAAGEAFDKTAKLLGLPYPGGPLIDRYAAEGNPERFTFPEPQTSDFDFSFSGLKTSVLYFLQKEMKRNPMFVTENLPDLCAAIQRTIVNILIKKITRAALHFGVREVALAGGVSANRELRNRFAQLGSEMGWKTHIPPLEYCTDNAAMIAMAAHYKYLKGEFCGQDTEPLARYEIRSST